MPDGFTCLLDVFRDPFLDDALAACVVRACDGAAEDVAGTGVDLQVQEGCVQEDVRRMVEGEGGGAHDLEFFGEEVVPGGETGDVGAAEGIVVGVPGCVRGCET